VKRIIHEERLRGVHPQLVLLAKNWVAQLPFDVLIVEGVRTNARQVALYEQGRTTPGPIVTMAKDVLQSAHGRRWVHGVALGCAIDAVPCTGPIGQPTWQDHQALALMGNIAEDMGLTWGGNWGHFADPDHFQLPGWKEFQAVPDDSPPTESTA
jgi:peptidoglycan L-alanyl-D-glutamate endopeptidase CwlK